MPEQLLIISVVITFLKTKMNSTFVSRPVSRVHAYSNNTTTTTTTATTYRIIEEETETVRCVRMRFPPTGYLEYIYLYITTVYIVHTDEIVLDAC